MSHHQNRFAGNLIWAIFGTLAGIGICAIGMVVWRLESDRVEVIGSGDSRVQRSVAAGGEEHWDETGGEIVVGYRIFQRKAEPERAATRDANTNPELVRVEAVGDASRSVTSGAAQLDIEAIQAEVRKNLISVNFGSIPSLVWRSGSHLFEGSQLMEGIVLEKITPSGLILITPIGRMKLTRSSVEAVPATSDPNVAPENSSAGPDFQQPVRASHVQ